jgi:putative solute:sodium symporter small subunit
VLSILLVEPPNRIEFAGFKLGFWIAQQGSIVAFIALILVYCLRMQKLDREFDVDEEKN